MRVNHEKLAELISAIFVGAGSQQREADCVAEHLVKANLAGHDSHGVIRTPIYVRWLAEKKVFANRRVQVVLESEAMTLLDGQMGLGQSIGKQTMDVAIEKCRQLGVSVTGLRNSGHLGRIGHWAELAVDAGFVALNFVNTSGLGMHVVPFGGVQRRMSVNPITIGIPSERTFPLVLDIAAAATAEGKLKVARNKGEAVPPGWILTADGEPTTDPNDFYGPPSGAILPFGGHKGSGLGLMAELLAGALTGGGCSRDGVSRLEQNMLTILLDPRKLQAGDGYLAEIERYVDFVKSAKTADPHGEILAPGEIEYRNRQQRERNGIDLDETTWRQLVETAAAGGVAEELVKSAGESA